MYTSKRWDVFGHPNGIKELWEIYDPDGDYICAVLMKHEADALLSHLNRG